ncbi:hypothetical protein LshimejAT787_1000160 [Lyophyllum shimeji]|uniref:Uncharacterized protein n=1 Tax=Lyophyllum shimeji TaxID=47721 RepID=A0A9P3PUD5_LYOSH|nr:hypothetical protein LshimejAT787_1000160 [Lyophyllum shimeji]
MSRGIRTLGAIPVALQRGQPPPDLTTTAFLRLSSGPADALLLSRQRIIIFFASASAVSGVRSARRAEGG